VDRYKETPFSGLEHDVRPRDDMPDTDYYDSRSYLTKVSIATLDISVIAAFWYAGSIANERLPSVAADLLERGLNSQHLGLIAGITNPKITRADIDEDLVRAFRELGVDAPMAVNTAQLIAARHIAREVTNGRLDAAKGASVITELFDREAQSSAGRIIRIHSDLVRRIRRNSPEEDAAKADVVAACRDFLMANGEPTQK
jgi:hypothetical protein